MVVPDLDTPGRIAKPCASPKNIISFVFMFSILLYAVFFELGSFNTSPVKMSITPMRSMKALPWLKDFKRKKRGIAVTPVERVVITIIFRSKGLDFGLNISINSVLNRRITASMVPRCKKIAREKASWALTFMNSIMNNMDCPSLLIGSHSTMPCIKPRRID
uniref:Uncharacterized protein n=1 Tax=Candidatus Methanophagaceae archaeon ANME-1 ERB6 TaxID=2759912 RepID=A0A7G9YYI7_9EURY|nr:hypothetical protein GGECLBBC_00010 [Methanosarcinales archaeon ANME-1 ERB6]